NTYDDDQNAAYAVATQYGDFTVQNPDKIVVAGYHRNSSDKSVFALARYYLDGTLDNTFGNGGVVTNPIVSGGSLFDGDIGVGLVVQGFGFGPYKLIVGGCSVANGARYFTLARYTAAGAFDTSFGSNGTGYTMIPLGSGVDAAANAMTIQSGN